jgi:class 3 adenylate cyclase
VQVRDGVESVGVERERKTVTVLFADIKGSMELMEDLDPEEVLRIVAPALQLMMEAVHRYEGYMHPVLHATQLSIAVFRSWRQAAVQLWWQLAVVPWQTRKH